MLVGGCCVWIDDDCGYGRRGGRKKEKLLSCLLVFMVSKVAQNAQYINIFMMIKQTLPPSIREKKVFSFLLL